MSAHDGTLAIGIDLGGTKIEAALVDRAGRIVDRVRVPTEAEQGPEGVLQRVIALVREDCLSRADGAVVAVGIGVAGQVDPLSGVVRFAPNLEWRQFPMGERLERALGLPVAVMNDVQAITYGEWSHGAGVGHDDLVCLFLGTGVGGGVVAGGKLLMGASGNAGELGHMIIDRHGPPCSCGSHGCLEAFAGGWAIARTARERAAAAPLAGRMLLGLAGGDPERIDAVTVSQAARAADPLARAIVDDVGRALGVGVASIANAFNPALVVLGGGVIEGMPELATIAREEAEHRALAAAVAPMRIVPSVLGAEAGAIGAARRARDRLPGREASAAAR